MLLGERAGGPSEFFDVAVRGGTLRAARFGTGEKLALGIHGLTGSCMQLQPVADLLGPEWTLVAPDLRGRGASNQLPEPYGLQSHAEDCAAVLRSFSTSAVVLGESLGGYVGVALAAANPQHVRRLVLADGGLPLPLPDGIDADEMLRVVVGPAVERLDQVYVTSEAYLDFWRLHPAVSEEWNSYVERYLAYDLEPVEGGFTPRARTEPVRRDAADLLAGEALLGRWLGEIQCPIDLVRAARDLLNKPHPLYPDDVVERWARRLPRLSEEMVEDTNHYTLMFGARGAQALARHVTAADGPR